MVVTIWGPHKPHHTMVSRNQGVYLLPANPKATGHAVVSRENNVAYFADIETEN